MSYPFDLKFYLKTYENVFDESFCTQTVESLKNINWNKHQYYTPQQTYISYDDDLSTSYDDIPQSNIINKTISIILQKYLLSDMPVEFEWFKKYNAYSYVRFNKYDENTLMRPHCDHIHDLFDGERKGIPVLSIVGSLNNDYEGGDFIMWGNQKIDIPAGTIIVFPSNFLYPHCVTKITKGSRYSFVSWAW